MKKHLVHDAHLLVRLLWSRGFSHHPFSSNEEARPERSDRASSSERRGYDWVKQAECRIDDGETPRSGSDGRRPGRRMGQRIVRNGTDLSSV